MINIIIIYLPRNMYVTYRCTFATKKRFEIASAMYKHAMSHAIEWAGWGIVSGVRVHSIEYH